MEVQELTLEALKEYKQANPDKFKHKFGDLDLDAIDYLKSPEHPDGFDMPKHRRKIRKMLPKTPLLEDLDEDEDDDEAYEYPTTKSSVDGGATLKEDNE